MIMRMAWLTSWALSLEASILRAITGSRFLDFVNLYRALPEKVFSNILGL